MLREALDKEEELAQCIEGYKSKLISFHASTTDGDSSLSEGRRYTIPSHASKTATSATVRTLLDLEEQRRILKKLLNKTGNFKVGQRDDDEKEYPPASVSSSSNRQKILDSQDILNGKCMYAFSQVWLVIVVSWHSYVV